MREIKTPRDLIEIYHSIGINIDMETAIKLFKEYKDDEIIWIILK